MTRTSDGGPLPYLSRRPTLMWSMGAALVVGLAANVYFYLNRPSSAPVPPPPSAPTLVPTVVLPASPALPSEPEPPPMGVPSLESGAHLDSVEQVTEKQTLESEPPPPSELSPPSVSSPPGAAGTRASRKEPRKLPPEIEGRRRAPNPVDGEPRDWSRPEF